MNEDPLFENLVEYMAKRGTRDMTERFEFGKFLPPPFLPDSYRMLTAPS